MFGFVYIKIWNSSRTESGTFKDGDLHVNRGGARIVSEDEIEAVTYFG